MFFFGKKSGPTITVLPHPDICPSGEIIPAIQGKSIAETLVAKNIEISHSCQFQCACTSCHVYVMEGSDSLALMTTDEDRLLSSLQDRDRWSRLSCQAIYRGNNNVIIEIRN